MTRDTGPGQPSPAERYAAARRRLSRGYPRLAAFREQLGFPLDDFQLQACQALERGSGVLVAAPTGAGKTVVGEFAVHLALAGGHKAFYTTPIKALSNQKYHDLVRTYGPDRVGLLTGDTTVNGEAPVVVMTTEVLRNMLYAGSPTLQGLSHVVMDEVHYLADRFRGPVWEEVILHLAEDVALVSLSATVSNAEELGDWLTAVRGDTEVVVSEHRPVPLGQHVLVEGRLLDLYAGHVDPTDPGPDHPVNPELVALLRPPAPVGVGPGRRHGPGERGYRGRPAGRRSTPRWATVGLLDDAGLLPAIFFIFSRVGCDAAVAQCVAADLHLTTPAQADEIRRIVEARCAALPPADLGVLGYWGFLDALSRGVAAHHAGMLPLFKEVVEELFTLGLVRVVFATETLALGINMPARSVVLERLVKWDGSQHVALTPGEYTQLTGRAGRRGIDPEGHAVVVDHPGLDLRALVGLASRRLYPLRSSFSPTYNMAVNLVARVGRTRAREVLEMSFAQFQADRGVVDLARTAQAQSEALVGYARAMQCHLGDIGEYARLRQELRDRERAADRQVTGPDRAVVRTLGGLTAGQVVTYRTGHRPRQAVVLEVAGPGGFAGPRVTLLTADRQIHRVTAADLSDLRTAGRLRLPSGGWRSAAARRDIAGRLRRELDEHPPMDAAPSTRHRASPGADDADDAELAALRRRLRAHPCHRCPDREEHLRWADRWHRLDADHTALLARIEGRTGSIAVVFDRVCEVLAELGYLATDAHGESVVTDQGEWLRQVYAEDDLLLAECVRRGAWDGLDAAGLAAVISTVVYHARRDDREDEAHVPGGPGGRLWRALDATVRIWSQLDDLEHDHGLSATGPLDLGLVGPVHHWASGRSLDAVLRDSDLAAGDLVRWCKQVVDVLDQLHQAAPQEQLRDTAHRAVAAVRRGVVAYSSV